MAAVARKEDRHPWLEALAAAPGDEVTALVEGYADVFPFNRAEPADAAVSLLRGLAAEDPARTAFDEGCLLVLLRCRDELLTSDAAASERAVGSLARTLAVVRRVRPRRTIEDLSRRYAFWFGVFECRSITDEKAKRAKSGMIKGTYDKLRSSAKKNVEAAVPRLAAMIEKHAP